VEIISRHRNLTILLVVLFAQILGLAAQVRRPTDGGSVRLVRLWAVTAVTPLENAVVGAARWVAHVWSDYLYLRNVRTQNQQLRDELQRLRLEQVRLAEDASQARRLQALLDFKEQFISQTLAAQVISTTGSDFSRGLYLDKGARDGVKPDMPVITPQGIVGKIYRVYPHSSLVLVINDPSSGAGVILERSRLQGILQGTAAGETVLQNIMSDESVQPGDKVLTSGGDRIYPKGLPVGVVTKVGPGRDLFLNIRVRPAARLDRLEEVLVITHVEERAPAAEEANGPVRASDILAQRLPSVPQKPADDQDARNTAPVTGKPAAPGNPAALPNNSANKDTPR
jgi:rod shape-determining protein MreC